MSYEVKNYLSKAKQTAGDKIKTEIGLYALAIDLREIENHNINAGVYEPYIEYNLQNGLYDKDPFCKHRLTINEVNAVIEKGNFDFYDKEKLFCYEKHFDPFDNETVEKIIDDMFEKGVLKKDKKKRYKRQMCF